MRISIKGINLIKKYEGCRLTAYKCPAGVWTIGYGHTGTVDNKAVCSGMRITSTKATSLLKNDLKKFEQSVSKLVKVKLNQNQFDALVSFCYNVGAGNLQKSTLLRYVNSKKFDLAAKEFKKWNKAGGKVLNGLTKRRAEERKLFLKESHFE